MCAPSQPRKVTAEELEVELADRTVPLVVDFYATWCERPLVSPARLCDPCES